MVYDDKKFSTVGAANTIFQWEDVIASVGYKTFSALRNNEGDALVTTTQISNDWNTNRTTTGTTEINFDHEFLAASDIGGTGFCTATIETSNGSSSGSATISVRLIHVDSSATEDEIVGTVTSDAVSSTNSEASRRVSVSLTIPLTHFSIGEKLRLEVSFNNTAGSAHTAHLYHDPANRIGTVSNDMIVGAAPRTDLTLTLPFRLPV